MLLGIRFNLLHQMKLLNFERLCVSQRLESEKESLERDLSFKADQARQYDSLLEAVRENNRQLQVRPSDGSITTVTCCWQCSHLHPHGLQLAAC